MMVSKVARPTSIRFFTFDGWFELFTMTTILGIVVVAIRKKNNHRNGKMIPNPKHILHEA
jgi:hypothetical protein